MGRPIKIAKAQAVLNVTATTAGTDVVTVSQNLETAGILRGMRLIFDTATGGLAADRTYWVLEVVSANTFTVSDTSPDNNPDFTPVTLSTGTTASVVTVEWVDTGFSAPVEGNIDPDPSVTLGGVVGGDLNIYGSQVQAIVCIGQQGEGLISASDTSTALTGFGTDFPNTLANGSAVTSTAGEVIGYVASVTDATNAVLTANSVSTVNQVSFRFGDNETGAILRQRGKRKYLVEGVTSGLVGICVTNSSTAADLLPDEMNLVGTYANATGTFLENLTNKRAEDFSGDEVLTTFGTADANTVPETVTVRNQ